MQIKLRFGIIMKSYESILVKMLTVEDPDYWSGQNTGKTTTNSSSNKVEGREHKVLQRPELEK